MGRPVRPCPCRGVTGGGGEGEGAESSRAGGASRGLPLLRPQRRQREGRGGGREGRGRGDERGGEEVEGEGEGEDGLRGVVRRSQEDRHLGSCARPQERGSHGQRPASMVGLYLSPS